MLKTSFFDKLGPCMAVPHNTKKKILLQNFSLYTFLLVHTRETCQKHIANSNFVLKTTKWQWLTFEPWCYVGQKKYRIAIRIPPKKALFIFKLPLKNHGDNRRYWSKSRPIVQCTPFSNSDKVYCHTVTGCLELQEGQFTDAAVRSGFLQDGKLLTQSWAKLNLTYYRLWEQFLNTSTEKREWFDYGRPEQTRPLCYCERVRHELVYTQRVSLYSFGKISRYFWFLNHEYDA